MALSLLRRVAGHGRVPVFVVAGAGERSAAARLRLDPRMRVVDSPRHAMVLLLVGVIDQSWSEPLHRLHDALPAPRATLWWARGAAHPPIPAATVAADQDIVEACLRHGRELIAGVRASEAPLLPDEQRHPWQGVGPYGQGGTGMTGGKPYGRALAGRADDLRDRLTLDVVPVTIGPFFTPLPDGLVLRVTFQGDIVHELEVVGSPADPERYDDIFATAATQPVSLRALEVERASAHLRWIADGLRLLGLSALSQRALRLSLAPDLAALRRLTRTVVRVVAPISRGVAPLPLALVGDRGLGTVARASGAREDARSDDPAYMSLGFEPVTQQAGDVWARWRQRLAEADQSLMLAGGAGDAVTGGGGRAIEGVRGVVGTGSLSALLELLPHWLSGSEWGDAVTAMASVDLAADVEDSAPRMSA